MIDAFSSDTFLQTFGVHHHEQRMNIKSMFSELRKRKNDGEDIEPYEILDLLDKPEGEDINLLPTDLFSIISSGAAYNIFSKDGNINSLTSGPFMRRDKDSNSTGGAASYAYDDRSNNRMNDQARARRLFNILQEQAIGIFSNNHVRQRVLAFETKAPNLNKFTLLDLVKQDNLGNIPFIVQNRFNEYTTGKIESTLAGNAFSDMFMYESLQE